MDIRNIFKKKAGKEEAKSKEAPKEESVKETKSTELRGNDFSYRYIVSPYLTEKTSILNGMNQYVFKVFADAGKIEIKKAVEKLYGVHVEKIRVAVVPGKERQLGRFKGEKRGFKKVIVRLREGDKIEVAH